MPLSDLLIFTDIICSVISNLNNIELEFILYTTISFNDAGTIIIERRKSDSIICLIL